MLETKGDLFHKGLNELLDEVKNNGIASIAYAENDEERLRLLAYMQKITRQEIKLKQLLKAYEAEMEISMIEDDVEGVEIETLASTAGVIHTYKKEEND